ncbi:MAG: hypothetical protein ABS35_15455 [Kaistia sp. SCN 65-12]|nr:MAG: hypothetical protein ABS35_15455 [Kaistia sp. SCN 65-12]
MRRQCSAVQKSPEDLLRDLAARFGATSLATTGDPNDGVAVVDPVAGTITAQEGKDGGFVVRLDGSVVVGLVEEAKR